jgi:hypothetical protein
MADNKKSNKPVLLNDKKKTKKTETAKPVKTKFKKFDEQYNDFIASTGGEIFGECKLGWDKDDLKGITSVLKEFKIVQEEIETGVRGQSKKAGKDVDTLANFLIEKCEELKCKAKELKDKSKKPKK